MRELQTTCRGCESPTRSSRSYWNISSLKEILVSNSVSVPVSSDCSLVGPHHLLNIAARMYYNVHARSLVSGCQSDHPRTTARVSVRTRIQRQVSLQQPSHLTINYKEKSLQLYSPRDVLIENNSVPLNTGAYLII